MSRARVEHLVRRFFASLRPRTLDQADEQWAHSRLTNAEITLFDRMTENDRVHSVTVARDVDSADVASWVVPAALLHDVGKIESGLGVTGRVVATLLDPLVGDGLSGRLAGAPGWFGRLGRHLRYTDLGAMLLGGISSDPNVRAWAAEHHMPSSRWTVPLHEGELLRAADDRAS